MELLGPLLAAVVVAVFAVLVIQGLVRRTTVYEWERALEYSSGRFVRVLEPGVHYRFRPSSMIRRIDVRPRFAVVPGQEILSSDGVPLKVSLIAHYAVADPMAAVTQVDDHVTALHLQLQKAAREVIGQRPIDEVLSTRAELGDGIEALSREMALQIGIELRNVSVRDVMLSGELKRTFAQVVQARQEGLAALERARGETAALRNLANAAKAIEGNPALYQLRLLQLLASQPGHTVILGGSAEGAVSPAVVQARRPPSAAKRKSAT
jgi:regulator of protease activity HflC (stomatin/prohibitin superfamily)